MKKRKSLMCALLAFALVQASAVADTKISINENKITMSTDGVANEWGTLVVVKSGDTLDNENIVTMKQALADDEGKMVFDFTISEAGEVNEKYDLYIKSADNDVRTEEMYYASVADRKAVTDEIKKCNDAEALTAIIDNAENETALITMGFDFEKYAIVSKNQSDAKEFADIFLKSKSAEMTDSQQVMDCVNKALLIEMINISKAEDEMYNNVLEMLFEDKQYADTEDDKLKDFIADYIYANKKYEAVEDADAAYECAKALFAVNGARFTEIEDTLKENKKILDIADNAQYKKYVNLKDKTDVNEYIAESLKNSPAKSVDSLVSVIKEAIEKNTKKSNNTTGGGGGGGNGGGGGGSSAAVSNSSSPTVLTPFLTPVKESVFSDLEGVSWAEEAINALAEKGIVVGNEEGLFNPNNTVKREEFVKMLVAALNIHNEKATCNFEDTMPGAWYYSYVATAFNKGLVYGVSEDNFGIGNNITRQDLAVMCYRAAKDAKDIQVVREKASFTDEESINDYAKEAVDVLYRAGVVNGVGDNEFSPFAAATRAQAAVIIYNLFLK